jgi:hypothetical protein
MAGSQFTRKVACDAFWGAVLPQAQYRLGSDSPYSFIPDQGCRAGMMAVQGENGDWESFSLQKVVFAKGRFC